MSDCHLNTSCIDVTTKGKRTEMYGNQKSQVFSLTATPLKPLRVSSLWVPDQPCCSMQMLILSHCPFQCPCWLAPGDVEKAWGWFSWEKRALCRQRWRHCSAGPPPPLWFHSLLPFPGKIPALVELMCWCSCPTYQEYVTDLGLRYTLTYLHLIFFFSSEDGEGFHFIEI